MSEQDRQWHESFKPSFTNDGQIIYRTSKPKKYANWKALPVVGNGKDVVVMGQHAGEKVRFTKLMLPLDTNACRILT